MNRRIFRGRIRNLSNRDVTVAGDFRGTDFEVGVPPGKSSPGWLDVDQVLLEEWTRIRGKKLDVVGPPLRFEASRFRDLVWNDLATIAACGYDLWMTLLPRRKNR